MLNLTQASDRYPVQTPTDDHSTLCRMPNTFCISAFGKLDQAEPPQNQEF
ncbi:MAG: hypothetical protein LH628_05325 [Microcoleus sp. CAN_BIN18]|nr:hypothetical protein [Microcoleus sp. CAN_BIN18]